MNMSSSCIATSSFAALSPIACQSLEMPIASVRPDSRMSVEPSSFDAASTFQVRLKDAYHGGLMEDQRRDPSHQEENSEDSDNLAAGTWYYRGEPVAAWVQPLAHGASSTVDKESQKDIEATCCHYFQISLETSHCMEAVFSMIRKIRGKTTRRSYGRFECDFGLWRVLMKYHSSSSNSSRKRLWHESEIVKELLLENDRTAFQTHTKANQWSDRKPLA